MTSCAHTSAVRAPGEEVWFCLGCGEECFETYELPRWDPGEPIRQVIHPIHESDLPGWASVITGKDWLHGAGPWG